MPVAEAFSVKEEVEKEVFTVRLELAALVQTPVPLLRRMVPMVTLPLLVSVPVARYSIIEVPALMTPVLLTTVLDAYKRKKVLPLVSPEPFRVPLMVNTEVDAVLPLASRPVLIWAVPVKASVEPAAMEGVAPEVYNRA